ncbi:MAG: hypothetical protein Q9190_004070 [Brigantiaea leucoxantha]
MQPPSARLLRALRIVESLSPTTNSKQLYHGIPCAYLTRTTPCSRLPQTLPRLFHSTSYGAFSTLHRLQEPLGPQSTDRGPASKEDTQTDFGSMNVLGNMPVPTTAIDACLNDGFHLDNGIKITGGSGCLLVAGEAFSWRPWDAVSPSQQGDQAAKMGQWDIPGTAWGLLELIWPKPDLLILGTGGRMRQVSKRTRDLVAEMGVRLDVLDTRNAAAQFNLLATERGIGEVAAALVPLER